MRYRNFALPLVFVSCLAQAQDASLLAGRSIVNSFESETAPSSGDQLDRSDADGERYRISDTWRAQLTWSRVITNYERDSDVFLLGAGAAF